jgi:hypothetical protein
MDVSVHASNGTDCNVGAVFVNGINTSRIVKSKAIREDRQAAGNPSAH